MKVVILAAGQGKRLRPLTEDVPKPMVRVKNIPIIEHILRELPDEITEIIMVVGYHKEKIEDYLGDNFEGKPITYVHQQEMLGTAHALGLCKEYLKDGERFLFMVADDLHKKRYLTNLLKHDRAILTKEHDTPERFGVIEVGENDIVKGIEEKPENPKSNLVSTGVYVLDGNIFNYDARLENNGEYYITDQVEKMMQDFPLMAERTEFWFPIGYPQDIEAAEKLLNEDE